MRECSRCKDFLQYDEVYDGYFCQRCNEWKTDKCTDLACHFCKNRPKKPKEEKNESNNKRNI